jgi:hypothetical protein
VRIVFELLAALGSSSRHLVVQRLCDALAAQKLSAIASLAILRHEQQQQTSPRSAKNLASVDNDVSSDSGDNDDIEAEAAASSSETIEPPALQTRHAPVQDRLALCYQRFCAVLRGANESINAKHPLSAASDLGLVQSWPAVMEVFRAHTVAVAAAALPTLEAIVAQPPETWFFDFVTRRVKEPWAGADPQAVFDLLLVC